MPPNDGMRIVIGISTRPRVRSRYFATWLTTWSSAGYENPSNWISTTAFHPASARPTAAPTIAASAIGVSNTRSAPNSCCNPSVTRKTPPSLPTSCPYTQDARIVVEGIAERGVQRRRHRHLRHRRAPPSRSRRNGSGGSAYVQSNIHSTGGGSRRDHVRPDARHLGLGCGVALRDERVVGVPAREQPRPVSLDRVERAPPSHLVVVAVAAGVVGGGVRADPVRHRLDQRRPAARASPGHRVLRDAIHGEHVVAVDADAREPVALRSLPDLTRRSATWSAR